MCWRIRFPAYVHLQKAHITADSKNVCFPIYRLYRTNISSFIQPKLLSAHICANTFNLNVSNRTVGKNMYMVPSNWRYNICDVNNDKTRQNVKLV